MLIGPAAAHPGNQSTGAGGYADLLNLQTLTVPSLAFAATVVRPFRGCDPNTILHIFCRCAMPYLLSRRVTGYSKATRRGSTTWCSISGSSPLSNLGRRRSSGCYFYGGIGVWPYLPIRTFPLCLGSDNTTVQSSRTFVGVFMPRHSAIPLRLVRRPQ